jgi:dihydroxyacetone kinase
MSSILQFISLAGYTTDHPVLRVLKPKGLKLTLSDASCIVRGEYLREERRLRKAREGSTKMGWLKDAQRMSDTIAGGTPKQRQKRAKLKGTKWQRQLAQTKAQKREAEARQEVLATQRADTIENIAKVLRVAKKGIQSGSSLTTRIGRAISNRKKGPHPN